MSAATIKNRMLEGGNRMLDVGCWMLDGLAAGVDLNDMSDIFFETTKPIFGRCRTSGFGPDSQGRFLAISEMMIPRRGCRGGGKSGDSGVKCSVFGLK